LLAEGDSLGFDEDGNRIPVVWPDLGEQEALERGAADAALSTIQSILRLIVEDGHSDGALVRAAAMGCLFGVYAHSSEAAKMAKKSHSTVLRAVSEMREKLLLCTQTPISRGTNRPGNDI